jgi:hypothetical protein
MEFQSRTHRMAELLERHLSSCDAALAACLDGREPDAVLDEWPLKRMLGLMKMSTQLANAISRLEAQTAPRIAKSEV